MFPLFRVTLAPVLAKEIPEGSYAEFLGGVGIDRLCNTELLTSAGASGEASAAGVEGMSQGSPAVLVLGA